MLKKYKVDVSFDVYSYSSREDSIFRAINSAIEIGLDVIMERHDISDYDKKVVSVKSIKDKINKNEVFNSWNKSDES